MGPWHGEPTKWPRKQPMSRRMRDRESSLHMLCVLLALANVHFVIQDARLGG